MYTFDKGDVPSKNGEVDRWSTPKEFVPKPLILESGLILSQPPLRVCPGTTIFGVGVDAVGRTPYTN